MSFLGSNEEILNTKEQCFICKNHTRFHVNLLKGKSRYSNRNLIDLMGKQIFEFKSRSKRKSVKLLKCDLCTKF